MTAMEPAYSYRAYCERVIDGDTFVARVDLGFQVAISVHVRVAGINAPEVHGATREIGLLAKTTLHNLLIPNTSTTGQEFPAQLILESHKDERSFERWVADIWLADTGESVGDLMVKAGQAARVDIP